MDAFNFSLSIALAVFGPLVAVAYMRPILIKVLRGLCDADGGAEFWVRTAFVLAISGTLMLTLAFGRLDVSDSWMDVLRRSIWLVALGVFITVGIISGKVWAQVQPMTPAARAAAAAAPSPATAAVADAARRMV